MNRKTVRRLLLNHRIIPFVEDILNKIDQPLSLEPMDSIYIVYSGDLDLAKKKKDYIEFRSREDADDFLSSYQQIWQEVPLEDMDQKEFEEVRNTVKWAYEGTIEDGTFKGTAEMIE